MLILVGKVKFEEMRKHFHITHTHTHTHYIYIKFFFYSFFRHSFKFHLRENNNAKIIFLIIFQIIFHFNYFVIIFAANTKRNYTTERKRT